VKGRELTCRDEIKDTDPEGRPVVKAEVDEETGRMMLDVASKERRVVRVEELVGGEKEGRKGLGHSRIKKGLVMSRVEGEGGEDLEDEAEELLERRKQAKSVTPSLMNYETDYDDGELGGFSPHQRLMSIHELWLPVTY
jgi:hypothetical protein